MKVMTLAAGFAAGYVLGSRAGRERFEQIAAAARKAQTHPAVAEVQEKAKQLLSSTTGISSSTSATASPASTAPETAPPAAAPTGPSRRRTPKGTAATGTLG